MNMKQVKKGLLSLLATLLVVTHGGMFASIASAKTYKIGEKPSDIIELSINGVLQSYFEVNPYQANGRIFVPLRFVSEELEASVDYNATTKGIAVHLNKRKVKLTLGSKKAMVDGKEKMLDVVPTTTRGRTFVPLRFVSEQLGATVDWKASGEKVVTHQVNISLRSQVSAEDQAVQAWANRDEGWFFGEAPGYRGNRDAFMRKNRLTNLPKNYTDYSYVLEGIPNIMYEMKGYNEYSLEQYKKTRKLSEAELKQALERRINARETADRRIVSPVEGPAIKKNVEDYYKLVLNVDWRTIEKSWVDQVVSLVNDRIDKERVRKSYMAFYDGVKKYKVKTSGSFVAEPSTITSSGVGPWMRGAVTFKVHEVGSSYDLKEYGGYVVNFGYSDRARPDEPAKYTKPFKIEVGKTYTGYTEIGIGEYGNEGIKIDPANNIFEFGIFKGIHF